MNDVADASRLIQDNIARADILIQTFKNLSVHQISEELETIDLNDITKEAIEMFRIESESIDCVLLDLSMPKLSGAEVFDELRKIRADVRVVLISGFTEQELMDRFRGTGLSGVVQKPTQLHVLLAKVGQAVGEAKGDTGNESSMESIRKPSPGVRGGRAPVPLAPPRSAR